MAVAGLTVGTRRAGGGRKEERGGEGGAREWDREEGSWGAQKPTCAGLVYITCGHARL